jgi:hypothetical protein
MPGVMTDFLKSNKRPPGISTPYDPLHPTSIDPGLSTGKSIQVGLPQNWQRLLENGGISKSDQEKAVMEIVRGYLEGGGDVSDTTGHAPSLGSSRSAPIPSAEHDTYPGLSEIFDCNLVPAVGAFLWFPTATL